MKKEKISKSKNENVKNKQNGNEQINNKQNEKGKPK